jgi:hypothetical protein
MKIISPYREPGEGLIMGAVFETPAASRVDSLGVTEIRERERSTAKIRLSGETS